MKRVWTCLLGVLFALALAQEERPCPTPEPPVPPRPEAPLAMPEEFRRALFEAVWEAVRNFYLFPDYRGTDWLKIRQDYEPRVLGTVNAWEVYALLEEMVASLQDPATRFIGPLVVEQAVLQDPAYGGIGALLDRSWAEREGAGLKVVYVFQQGPAARAGLKARDRILAVDGDPCPTVEKIRGAVGTEVRLRVASPGEGSREMVLVRERITPLILPEAQRLPFAPAYGYLRLLSLEDPQGVPAQVELELARLLQGPPLQGLILDLRGLGGGTPGALFGVLGQFASGRLGALYSRTETVTLEVRPGRLFPSLQGLPLAVLVDGETWGAAEVLAAYLQAHREAKVVGSPTPGQTQGVEVLDFPDNSILVLRVFGYALPDGTPLEGRGLKPDAVVEADWLSFSLSQDPHLLKALELLGHTPPPGR
ncbi:S41 family peptidase [Thermus thermamylovorans]|uniref:PDZ domain-containing protein n=1 Tax=Thermus thermamylovorans TaxID=2509362 RepID=A0A4Q9B6G9_9DEIN|nr:S41 family peptidase [Thermus thermamylovorans]TBH21020.1 PDZ domain-containing protein [Thermus thermamylovorans]